MLTDDRMSANEVLRYEVIDSVAHITLNRPKVLNAIDDELARALRATWTRLEEDPLARVGVVKGEGRAFCAGRDISSGAVTDEEPFLTHQAMPKNGVTLFKPLIAAVHGYALGAGFNLGVKCCDITICATSAILGFPEAKAGVAIRPLEYTPFMPFKLSLELAMLGWKGGRLLEPLRAYQLGLVNSVVDERDLESEVARWCEMLLQVPPLYVRAVKRGHYAAVALRARAEEQEYLDFVWPQETSEDLREARDAFREKRKPEFKGK